MWKRLAINRNLSLTYSRYAIAIKNEKLQQLNTEISQDLKQGDKFNSPVHY